MDYESFRGFADSWGLLGLLLFFVAAVLWTFRPGSGEVHKRLSHLPLTDED